MSKSLEFSIGIILLLAVGILFYESFNPLYEGFGQPDFPPMRFPRWILLGIGFLTFLHLVRTGLGVVVSEQLFSQTLWKRTLLVAMTSLAGSLLVDHIGFTFASIITFWVAGFLLGYRKYLLLTIIAVVFGLATWAVFTFLINIGLPTSPFLNRI